MGVACLKIEGRMKRPEYVGAVTGIYRRLLDEKRPPSPAAVSYTHLPYGWVTRGAVQRCIPQSRLRRASPL